MECGLPNTPRLEQPHVLAQLRLGIEPAAGVVEVHVAAAVKPREIAAAQLIEHGGVRVIGMVARETPPPAERLGPCERSSWRRLDPRGSRSSRDGAGWGCGRPRRRRRSGGCPGRADRAAAGRSPGRRRDGRAARAPTRRPGVGMVAGQLAREPRKLEVFVRGVAGGQPRRRCDQQGVHALEQRPRRAAGTSVLDRGRAARRLRAAVRAGRRRPSRSARRSVPPPSRRAGPATRRRWSARRGCRRRTGSGRAGAVRTVPADRRCSTKRCRRTDCAARPPRARSMPDQRSPRGRGSAEPAGSRPRARARRPRATGSPGRRGR